MKTIKITKAEVIKAIKTEPLKQGQFVSSNFDEDKYSKEEMKQFKAQIDVETRVCPVCVVGATLRQAVLKNGLDKKRKKDVGAIIEDIVDYNVKRDLATRKDEAYNAYLAGETSYLTYLSGYYEGLNYHPKTGESLTYAQKRNLMLQFVKTTCPEVIKIKV